MTKELLESYKSQKEEIKELQYKLEHLGDGDSMIGNDTIFDYRSGYPMPQSVVGVDWNKVDQLKKRYENKLEILTKECEEIEMFIEEIPDSMTRRIFRMYYIENMTQRQVAKKVHMDKSTVARKIDNFLKVAPNAPNAPL